jgi:hypothetical protein
MNLIAYHAKADEKAAILKQLRAHAKADELVKGITWENGKGCAVGCTLHSYNHMEYESRFGIPVMLARLEDCIFEGLPNARAKKWPIEFMSAIKPCADLGLVGWRFLHWLLTDEKVNPGINHPLVRDAVKQCADVIADLAAGKKPNRSAAESAEAAAWSAAAESARAAWSAAAAARAAAWSAWSARAAAESARAAAESARAAESAAWSAAAESARAAWSAESYIKMASKLLELIKAAPMAA